MNDNISIIVWKTNGYYKEIIMDCRNPIMEGTEEKQWKRCESVCTNGVKKNGGEHNLEGTGAPTLYN